MHVLLFNSDYKTKKTVRFTHTNVINTFAHAHLLGWWGVRGQRSGYCTVTDALIWWAQLSQLELAKLQDYDQSAHISSFYTTAVVL